MSTPDTIVFRIDGTNYGLTGANALRELDVTATGPGRQGTGGARLSKVASYDIVDGHEVEIYAVTPGTSTITRKYLGGFIDNRGLASLDPSNMKKWDLGIVDYQRLLAKEDMGGLVFRAEDDAGTDIPAGTMDEQLEAIAYAIQRTGSVNSPAVSLSTAGVVDLLSGAILPVIPWSDLKGKTLGDAIRVVLKAVLKVDNTLRPTFFVGLDYDDLGSFGGAVLHVFDRGDVPATADIYFSDGFAGQAHGTAAPAGTYHYWYSFDRQLGGMSGNFQQSMVQGAEDTTTAVVTYADITSRDTYPNPYDAEGFWRLPPRQDTESGADSELALAKLATNVRNKAYPRETITIEVDEYVRPGMWVGIKDDNWSLDDQVYLCVGVAIKFLPEAGGWPRLTLTLGNFRRLPGENDDDEAIMPPVERDYVVPNAPTGFFLWEQVPLNATGEWLLIFRWDSPGPRDLRYYEVMVDAGGRVLRSHTTGHEIGVSVPSDTSWTAHVEAQDLSGNWSPPSTSISGTTTFSAVADTPRNPAFADAQPLQPTLPGGWTDLSSGTGTVERISEADGGEVLTGTAAVKIVSPSVGNAGSFQSDPIAPPGLAYAAGTGSKYELEIVARTADGSPNGTALLGAIFAGDTPESLTLLLSDNFSLTSSYQTFYLPFDMNAADGRVLSIYISVFADAAGSRAAWIDRVSLIPLTSAVHAAAMSRADYAKLGQFGPATGKILTVSNSLTLSGTDGEALTLTGSLTVAADTTISGGGTLALGGFTLTVPDTGTVALLGKVQTFTEQQAVTATLTSTVAQQQALAVTGTVSLGGNSSQQYNAFKASITSSAAAHNIGSIVGLQATADWAGVGGTLTNLFGLSFTASTGGATTGAVTNLRGLNFNAYHFGQGLVTLLSGGFANAWLRPSGTGTDGSITTLNGFQLQTGNLSTVGGTVGTARGLLVSAPAGTGTITTVHGLNVENQGRAGSTTSYGVKIEDQSASATAYALYTGTGAVRLGDHVTLVDGKNIITGTTTGMQIATGATQKLGFFGKTPIVRPTLAADATDLATAITLVNDIKAKLGATTGLGLVT